MNDLTLTIRGILASAIQEREDGGHTFLDVRREEEGVIIAFTPNFDLDPDAGLWAAPQLPN